MTTLERVKEALAAGKSREDIYKDLLGSGVPLTGIEGAFAAVAAENAAPERHKKLISIVMIFGVLLIGAGIFSLVAANWEYMDKGAKIGTIVFFMLLSYAIGWFMKERMASPKTGAALIMLGNVIFGSGIFLVAQIFNIRGNWPDGFILWMLGSLAMAVATEVFPLYIFAVITGAIAVVGHPFDIFDSFPADGLRTTSTLLLLAATVATAVAGYFMERRVRKQFPDKF